MTHRTPLLALLSLLGIPSLPGRDINRQKYALFHPPIKDYASTLLSLHSKTGPVLPPHALCTTAQRSSYSSDRSTRLYKYRIEDMQDLTHQARQNQDTFIATP
ncbi:MAG: hypothetical protein PVJ92_01670 [Candidatus Dependentiae bacterium]|jgi:hypothetical protein